MITTSSLDVSWPSVISHPQRIGTRQRETKHGCRGQGRCKGRRRNPGSGSSCSSIGEFGNPLFVAVAVRLAAAGSVMVLYRTRTHRRAAVRCGSNRLSPTSSLDVKPAVSFTVTRSVYAPAAGKRNLCRRGQGRCKGRAGTLDQAPSCSSIWKSGNPSSVAVAVRLADAEPYVFDPTLHSRLGRGLPPHERCTTMLIGGCQLTVVLTVARSVYAPAAGNEPCVAAAGEVKRHGEPGPGSNGRSVDHSAIHRLLRSRSNSQMPEARRFDPLQRSQRAPDSLCSQLLPSFDDV